MSLLIKDHSDLEHTLGRKTFRVGRSTRDEMIKALYEHSKRGYGGASAERHVTVGETKGSGRSLHFEMKNERGGALDSGDVRRLAHEFFGARHGTEIMMTKKELAKNMTKKIHGLSEREAERLVETLINEVHGHDAHEKLEKEERHQQMRHPDAELADHPRTQYGDHGEVIENEHHFGEVASHTAPAKSDPMLTRGALPSRGESGTGSAPSFTPFKDLHLHLH